ncbi:PaaI family thioesterase [Halobaculum sp. CBA1158]|uniref:PaaI family thioesterase n=1 Tax=Halobaculum sp. CBA1158 TaxID=2904243 RepID=UPI001F2F2BB0|nr:PaaI family thioesterase [Halobaculum sp. CBA1158]UIP00728.1 PaaI family thioesterase [Halobaculum sp. CBA1158]
MSDDLDRDSGPISPDHVDLLQAFIESHGFLSWLDLTVEDLERGRIVMSVPYDEKLVNPGSPVGSVHGGIAATLVDTASGFALRSTFDDPTTGSLATTDLNVTYLRPATDDLRVEAEVLRAGGSMGYTDTLVSSVDPDGEPKDVAVGRTSYRLFPDADRE